MYKILLADDEGIVLDSLQFIISKNFGESCDVRTAKNGRQAIEIAQDFVPDITFMDIQMPGIKGIEAIREIRSFNKKCQFIIMSAYDKFTFAQEAINLGVIEYLTKPASREKIVAALEKAMGVIDQARTSRSENLLIREKLESVVPIIENGFINLILFQDDPAPSLDRYRDLLNIRTDYGSILVIEFGEDGENGTLQNPVGTTVKLQNHQLAFRETVKDFLPSSIIGSVMAGTVSLFLPHESPELPYEERITLIENTRNMLRKLKKQIDLRFRAGIGNIWSITEQSKSYEEAKKALRIDQSSVIHLRDIKLELQYEHDYPDALERQIFQHLLLGDTDGVIRCSSQFFDWMVESYPNYEQCIRLKSVEFVMTAEREVFLKGGMPYGFLYRKDYLDSILACSSYDELRRWFIGKMSDACRNYNEAKDQKETTIVGKARQYIDEHFDRELSLEDVSKYVDVSPYYFSKLFKEEMNQTFVEYLTGLRIEKARSMLADPSASIKEVCLAVGYNDPNYFSRIFKKVTGVTPTDYRDRR